MGERSQDWSIYSSLVLSLSLFTKLRLLAKAADRTQHPLPAENPLTFRHFEIAASLYICTLASFQRERMSCCILRGSLGNVGCVCQGILLHSNCD